MDKIALIYFDGGSRGNPGAAAGAAIIEFGGRLHTFSRYLGEVTSPVAEYGGLILALEKALELGIQQAKIHGDSELIIKHLNGVYKVRKPHLRSLYDEARTHLSKIIKYELLWIPREQNTLADAAVNECIDKAL
ncbi:MAG: ribonuclease HI family protein [Scytonema sp. RU_4_4]|nr:ribonuclease HI family protein [Scytonema sp. RU_4_4]